MQKEIKLGDKVYTLSTNAYTPIAYKKEFGKDYFQDLFNMLSAESIMNQLEQLEEGEVLKAKDIDMSILSDFDMTFFHRLFWVFAKSAQPTIKAYEEFFMDIDEFPIQKVGPVLMNMLNQGMTTRKKSMRQQQRVRKSSR
ncbi:hypothetical protein ABNB56_10030 [Streptococcus iniae]|uniref:hypothetical protein n=1 Tax=Streptococcus iniae TaxID=1346 RepID=UPI000EFADF41|nr:hypothetical protein [Streptococcus iniae]RMI73795.1 hypothetical protein DIX58_10075 [Streptococcus iniae]